MKIIDFQNRERKISIKKYLVDYDKSSKSKFQFNVKQFFKTFWQYDAVCEEFRIPGCLLRIDLINFDKKIAVECQSMIHDNFSTHFHKTRSAFLKSWRRDESKQKWIEDVIQFKFLEIYPEDLKLLSRKYILEKFSIDIL